jgi:hypothetical protein
VPRSADLSATQTVALRFPEDAADEPEAEGLVTAGISGAASLALLSPNSISPQTAVRPEPSAPPAPSPGQHVEASLAETTPSSPPLRRQVVASLAETTLSSPSPERAVATPPPVAHHVTLHPKPTAVPVHKVVNRPGFVLNDTQIASIKRRLQLTPDQERMWPAVEAALRSIAYAKAHGEARRYRGQAGSTQMAEIDPNSPEVQGLKSAAVPLIMSFNSEQKSEVRTLAHVMGLDQLASQF